MSAKIYPKEKLKRSSPINSAQEPLQTNNKTDHNPNPPSPATVITRLQNVKTNPRNRNNNNNNNNPNPKSRLHYVNSAPCAPSQIAPSPILPRQPVKTA